MVFRLEVRNSWKKRLLPTPRSTRPPVGRFWANWKFRSCSRALLGRVALVTTDFELEVMAVARAFRS